MHDETHDDPGGAPLLPGEKAGMWAREHAAVLLYALLLLLVMPMRDLWAPDEPDFAQCVKEMQQRGAWVLPWWNGQPYSEKPILFYWAMKGSNRLLEVLTGGLGFSHGVAAWALRLPSVVASVAFLLAFQRWATRFLQGDVAKLAILILATMPLWFWQGQAIQADMVFTACLAWAWLCWLAGYAVDRGLKPELAAGEGGRWFLQAYLFLGLAFLAKGPLAFALSLAILLVFLAWQRDWGALARMRPGVGGLLLAAVVLPWLVLAGLAGGAGYLRELLIHQNLDRAIRAWDHVQPWWKYLAYLLGDAFPWILLAPALAFFLRGSGALKNVMARFCVVALMVPLLVLSGVQSKQGKYLLPSYPFLALLLAGMLQPVAVEGVSSARIRRLGLPLAVGLGLVAGVCGAVALGWQPLNRFAGQLETYRGLAAAMGILGALGALSVLGRSLSGGGQFLVQETALTLGLLFLVGGTWGFRKLDARKGYREWAHAVEPLIQGRRVYFWQTLRSGALVYGSTLMPEVRDARALSMVGPEDRLVSLRREWDGNLGGLTPQVRAGFQVEHSRVCGESELLLLKRVQP